MENEGLAYVLGHTKEELARLETQAEIFKEPTEETLKQAGLKEGMRVLDLGCGVGDVSLLAAKLVGPTGSVTGVDQSDDALGIARSRASMAGAGQIRFIQGDVGLLDLDDTFDAIIGRFILMHLADPVGVLRRAREKLAPGGAMAFIELDVPTASVTPPVPLFDQCLEWLIALYQRAGAEPNMGSHLYGVFHALGLTPQMNGSCRVETGANTAAPEYLAETIRAISPNLERLGVAHGDDIDVDTLGARIRASVSDNHCFIYPRLIGAWVTVER